MKKTKYLLIFLICTCLLSLQAAPTKKTICLNMIVKNESAVITRCLESVLPLIDSWVIVDMGSTDGTQEIIKKFLKDIPGELHERPWVNFGHNREEALELAKVAGDYILIMDADDLLSYSEHFVFPELTADCYNVFSQTENFTSYFMPRILKSDKDWHWHGVVSEYVAAPDAKLCVNLDGLIYQYNSQRVRLTDPLNEIDEIKILKEAIEQDPQNQRYVFYLAQSYLSLDDPVNALVNYAKRAAMGGWEEEVFWSKLQIAKIEDSLEMDLNSVKASYYQAYKYRPTRLEPLFYLAQIGRLQNDFDESYRLMTQALNTPFTKDILFVEKWIYDYGLLFEFSIAAYWVGEFEESLAACDKLLAMPDLPEEYRQFTEYNRTFAFKANSEEEAL